MLMQMKTLKPCSSSIVDYEDILVEILLRVPARPVVRFKCVSKRWLSLISHSSLCHRHTLRNPRPAISAFFAYSSTYFDYIPLRPAIARKCINPLNFVDTQYGVEIVQSCNGLFLCRLQKSPLGVAATSLIYYVLNPTTNKFCSLTPPAAAASTPHQIIGYALAFDPSISPHYKVLFLWFFGASYSPDFRIERYSSETRTWRLLDFSFVRQIRVDYTSGVYFNGALHWVGDNLEMSYYHINEERLGLVHGLPIGHHLYHDASVVSRYFRESRDSLHLIDVDITIPWSPSRTKFRVLEMGKDYSGWSLKYNVDLAPLYAAYPRCMPTFFVVLGLTCDDNEKDSSSLLQLHVPHEIIHYNLQNNTFKSTHLTPTPMSTDDEFFRLYRKSYHYVESLAVV